MTSASDPAREFLDAFNEIERHLRERLHAADGVSFANMVRDLAPNDRMIRNHETSLRVFASLRNAISHGTYQGGLPIATPRPETVQAILQVRDHLLRPPTIDKYVQTRGEVECADIGESLWRPLLTMGQRRYSQMPVYQAGTYRGLLTTNAVARWLSAQIGASGDLMIEEASVCDALAWAEPHEVAKFMPRRALVTDAIDVLSASTRTGGEAPIAVIVTRNGKETEPPLGMFVIYDLPELLICLQPST